MGFIAVVILTITMMFMLKWFGDSPLSRNTKIAVSLKSEFQLEAVGTDIRAGSQKTVLLVHYETKADSKFSLAAQSQEMKKIADFAAGKLEPLDRRKVDEIQVRRTEVRGRGCWQRSLVSDEVFPNPARNAGMEPGGVPVIGR